MNDRRCIITRTSRPADELIRFVAAPDGTVVPDLKARLPGRGAWVTANKAVIERAVRGGMFSRALKQRVSAADDLAVQVGALLLDRALGSLGLAARAGAVITGFTKVDRAARQGKLALVLTASDGAADGQRKVSAAIASAPAPAPAHIGAFTGNQLSLALGRTNVIHAGVVAGRAAASREAAAMRYESYCDGKVTEVCAA